MDQSLRSCVQQQLTV